MMQPPLRVLLAAGLLGTLVPAHGLCAQEKRDLKDPPVEERQPRILNFPEIARLVREAYPRDALRAGISGTVVTRFRLFATGIPDTASFRTDSTPDPRFAAAARRVVAGMRFEPAALGGRPVAVWVRVPIYFHPSQRHRRGRTPPTDSSSTPAEPAPAPPPP
jgi:TonB family protein